MVGCWLIGPLRVTLSHFLRFLTRLLQSCHSILLVEKDGNDSTLA